ncbi:patatin-like phospholipase family protein [Sinorhizobium sp. BG8]|uniref:patatin-like phospholipase family protein n=1 Tax=Sinorhizobium sp. BG8 TaxID=2613773 RepID=UPI00193E5E89|nr:patatin-like phospholipase family protein [Sinorhizobium sp. BG8]QRM55413.1 Patatin [Sinorhizobium sp. BG8]
MLNWSFNRSALNADVQDPGGSAMNDMSQIPARAASPRAKIALALGGGAARGWAHIGVLRALDEEEIGISMIAGTSIGALVGGCYLAGKLDELEIFARSLTMRRIASLLDFTIRGSGLFGGMRLTRRMQEHLEHIQIETLDRPFVAVATEINSGHEVWIESGALITAIRASYALPGIFEPIPCNGRTLVDGALVNPVPVSVCRTYEQPLVVAVNLNYDLYGRSAVIKLNANLQKIDETAHQENSAARLGLTSVMVQAFNIIQDRISRARLAGDPPDLALHPKLSDIGLSEFHRAGEAIDRGYAEAKAKIAEIRRMQEVLIR